MLAAGPQASCSRTFTVIAIPEFCMYGMESGQEFLAGWTDGMLAAKVAMRNAVRRELLRYALELTPDDGVVAAASPDPAAEKVTARKKTGIRSRSTR